MVSLNSCMKSTKKFIPVKSWIHTQVLKVVNSEFILWISLKWIHHFAFGKIGHEFMVCILDMNSFINLIFVNWRIQRWIYNFIYEAATHSTLTLVSLSKSARRWLTVQERFQQCWGNAAGARNAASVFGFLVTLVLSLAATVPLSLALARWKVWDSKLRNAGPLCLIYFTPDILSWFHEQWANIFFSISWKELHIMVQLTSCGMLSLANWTDTFVHQCA